MAWPGTLWSGGTARPDCTQTQQQTSSSSRGGGGCQVSLHPALVSKRRSELVCGQTRCEQRARGPTATCRKQQHSELESSLGHPLPPSSNPYNGVLDLLPAAAGHVSAVAHTTQAHFCSLSQSASCEFMGT